MGSLAWTCHLGANGFHRVMKGYGSMSRIDTWGVSHVATCKTGWERTSGCARGAGHPVWRVGAGPTNKCLMWGGKAAVWVRGQVSAFALLHTPRGGSPGGSPGCALCARGPKGLPRRNDVAWTPPQLSSLHASRDPHRIIFIYKK